MNKYLLTSTRFNGAVEFGYDASGLLVHYLVEAELTNQQLAYLLSKFPFEEKAVLAMRDLPNTNLTVKALDQDLSFEAFWKRYSKKIHPHRCEPLWKKMSDAVRALALAAIDPYMAYLSRTGVAQASPENYIKKKYWLTNWSKE